MSGTSLRVKRHSYSQRSALAVAAFAILLALLVAAAVRPNGPRYVKGSNRALIYVGEPDLDSYCSNSYPGSVAQRMASELGCSGPLNNIWGTVQVTVDDVCAYQFPGSIAAEEERQAFVCARRRR